MVAVYYSIITNYDYLEMLVLYIITDSIIVAFAS